MDNKMVDMRVKIISNEEKNVENSNTISNVNSVVEEHSALITSVSEQVEQQQAMIKNNTQRMDSITRNLTAEKSDKEEPGQTEPEENMGMPGQNCSQGDPGLAMTTSLPSSLAYQGIIRNFWLHFFWLRQSVCRSVRYKGFMSSQSSSF